jgi:hypothetical protein
MVDERSVSEYPKIILLGLFLFNRLINRQVPQTRRHLPEQPHALLPYRWERQIHAIDESGSRINALLGASDCASITTLDRAPEHVVGE